VSRSMILNINLFDDQIPEIFSLCWSYLQQKIGTSYFTKLEI
jgi:hypothetical protein